MLLFSIFMGGMLGSVARYRMAGWVYRRIGSDFPWGTLSVNVTGSLALGLTLPLLELHGPLTNLRGFLTVGCIGAFTTFSTFAYEAVMLLQSGERRRAAAYVLASVILGLIGIGAGVSLTQRLF